MTNEPDININVYKEPEEKTVKNDSDSVKDEEPYKERFMTDEFINTASDWRNIARKHYESRFDNDDSTRLRKAEFDVRMLLQYSERQERKIKELERTIEASRISLNYMSRDLDKAMYKCHQYENIAKEKAKRARKRGPDKSAYICLSNREYFDRYETTDENGKQVSIPILAYKTVLQMPYPSQLGYAELRRLLEIDLVENGYDHILYYNEINDGLGYRLGLNRIVEGLPADGKHPGPLEGFEGGLTAPNILYRVLLKLCGNFPEAELFTTKDVLMLPEVI